MTLEMIGQAAKKAAAELAQCSTDKKNNALRQAADALVARSAELLAENLKDVGAAVRNKVKSAFIDRLTLTEKRIADLAKGLRDVAALNDPVGEYVLTKTLPNGLILGQRRVPLGVIAIIYESRPNVTSDAFGLCLKAGNATILRGGKEAIGTNLKIVEILREALAQSGVNPDAVQILSDTSHETAAKLMGLREYVDVLIPRGGANLISSVIQNSSVPCIETGLGNCHVFMDESGDPQKAVPIIINAKTQRPGVCNAMEKLLIHEAIYQDFAPVIAAALREKGVEIRGDDRIAAVVPEVIPATEEDWYTEYEDYIIAIKVVKDLDEAIAHIGRYSTKHSEAIITEHYGNAQRFLNEIDAAAVYVNASTRFTDGGEFGFGAEIGISTQKLHARGPMGLKELTSTKYVIYGNGQIRK
ncbi:MAG: glutamate-5-semialdehyde dehydrogenase [Fusobacteriaceae bacterium]|jgi:glutamate-5-semialdehyde dehydrogenase|nr:glutamate-5-semialdehyde dehydrogenase [Fusobacteriaceae bacterium]